MRHYQVHVGKKEKLIKLPDYSRRIEFIGDSLSSGYAASLEGLSSMHTVPLLPTFSTY